MRAINRRLCKLEDRVAPRPSEKDFRLVFQVRAPSCRQAHTPCSPERRFPLSCFPSFARLGSHPTSRFRVKLVLNPHRFQGRFGSRFTGGTERLKIGTLERIRTARDQFVDHHTIGTLWVT
jgi:hypothetical protein